MSKNHFTLNYPKRFSNGYSDFIKALFEYKNQMKIGCSQIREGLNNKEILIEYLK